MMTRNADDYRSQILICNRISDSYSKKIIVFFSCLHIVMVSPQCIV